jgi:hypothetical protein
MKRLGVLAATVVASFAIALAQGCASSQKTTAVTTTTNADGGAADTQPAVDGSANPTPGTSTTTTTTQSNEPDSVLGATAHAIGTIILFPFRLIGDALGLIF